MKCVRCGTELSATAKFCPHCGAARTPEEKRLKCRSCGAVSPDGSNFCVKCGRVLHITEKLIQSAMDGGQQAITELYEFSYQSVYHTVKALIRDEDTVLDVVQDSYIKGFQNLSQLEKPENYLAWMKRIAANTAKNELKRKKPLLFTEMSDEENELILNVPDERTQALPDMVLDQQETARLIDEILDTLSDEQRMVVGMYYYEEMSVKEIAAQLECSENTVKSRLSYGRRKIEGKVRKLEEEGTKLYSLSPVPFFLLLLRNMDMQPVEAPPAMLLQTVLRKCVSGGATGYAARGAASSALEVSGGEAKTAGTARAFVQTATETAAKTAAKRTAAKAIAAVLAVAVAGGAAGAAIHYSRSTPPEESLAETLEETETASPVPERPPESVSVSPDLSPEAPTPAPQRDWTLEECVSFETTEYQPWSAEQLAERYAVITTTVPQILSDSADAKAINIEIQQFYEIRLENDSAFGPADDNVSSDAWLVDNLLFLCLDPGYIQQYYVFDMTAEKRMDNNDMAEFLNMPVSGDDVVKWSVAKYLELEPHCGSSYDADNAALVMQEDGTVKVAFFLWYPSGEGGTRILCDVCYAKTLLPDETPLYQRLLGTWYVDVEFTEMLNNKPYEQTFPDVPKEATVTFREDWMIFASFASSAGFYTISDTILSTEFPYDDSFLREDMNFFDSAGNFEHLCLTYNGYELGLRKADSADTVGSGS